MLYCYYSIMRPVSIGTYPKPEGNEIVYIHNYKKRVQIEGVPRPCWGYILYEKPLSAKDALDYELYGDVYAI